MADSFVYVKHRRQENIMFACREEKHGWRCGWCLRGLLLNPRRKTCRVCKSFVSKIITLTSNHEVKPEKGRNG